MGPMDGKGLILEEKVITEGKCVGGRICIRPRRHRNRPMSAPLQTGENLVGTDPAEPS